MTTANTAAAGAPRITVIDPRAPERAKLRVAAYARVSSDSDDQINSYIAQVDFYSKYIASKEDWEMVDIYADEGITGLEARRRDDFNRMMEDCRAGKDRPGIGQIHLPVCPQHQGVHSIRAGAAPPWDQHLLRKGKY